MKTPNMNLETDVTPATSSRAAPPADINWKAMFDASGTGFIASVENAPNSKALYQILDLVINSLFVREEDYEIRDGYLAMAREATGTENLEKSMQASVMLLEHIKRQRVRAQTKTSRESDNLEAAPAPAETPEQDAEEARNDLARDAGAQTEEPAEENAGERPEEQAPEQQTRFAPASADGLFIDFICRSIRQRLDAVALPRLDSYKSKERLPFILSPDFADHFEQILKTTFLPVLARNLRGFLLQLESQPERDREDFLRSALEGRKHRTAILEGWRTVWRDLAETKELPKKPASAASGGLLDRLVDKVKDKPARRREMTPEQWRQKAQEIKAANAEAEKNWQAIARDDGKYLPPEERDKRLLMDLLARSASGLEKQITTLRQIASQGGNTKAYDTYATGRNLDLAMLSAYYRYPEHFQAATGETPGETPGETQAEGQGEGESRGENQPRALGEEGEGEIGGEGFLKRVLKGYRASERRSLYPLVDRYIYSAEE